MTLSTNVYVIRAAVPPRTLFHLGRDWLGCTDQHRWTEKPRHPVYGQPGYLEIGNDIGQGLPAIWEVVWCPDAPYRAQDHACTLDEQSEPIGNADCVAYDCDPGPACAYKAWFDTSYGYRGPNSSDCGDIHAYLIAKIAEAVGPDNILWNADTIDEDLPFSELPRLGDPERGNPLVGAR